MFVHEPRCPSKLQRFLFSNFYIDAVRLLTVNEAWAVELNACSLCYLHLSFISAAQRFWVAQLHGLENELSYRVSIAGSTRAAGAM